MRIAVLLIALLAAGCGGSRPAAPPAAATPTGEPLRGCDDGGDGGVMIHGVCL